jgi:hypothetical protein
MKLQVFVDRKRQFVTECEPGGVSTRVTYIKEMIPNDAEIIIVLESDRNSNVRYIVRKKRERSMLEKCNEFFRHNVEKDNQT